MDKFLKLINTKKEQQKKLENKIAKSEDELNEYKAIQIELDNIISHLDYQYKNNLNLMARLKKFPKLKKKVLMTVILSILVILSPILVIIPIFSILNSYSLFAAIIYSLFVIILSTSFIADGKKIINKEKRVLKGLNSKNLEEENLFIDVKKNMLETSKKKNEVYISDLEQKIAQFNFNLADLKETIQFITNYREKCICELCPDILDKYFAENIEVNPKQKQLS